MSPDDHDDHTGPDGRIFMWARGGGDRREEAWRSLAQSPAGSLGPSLPSSPVTPPQPSPTSGQHMVIGVLMAARPA